VTLVALLWHLWHCCCDTCGTVVVTLVALLLWHLWHCCYDTCGTVVTLVVALLLWHCCIGTVVMTLLWYVSDTNVSARRNTPASDGDRTCFVQSVASNCYQLTFINVNSSSSCKRKKYTMTTENPWHVSNISVRWSTITNTSSPRKAVPTHNMESYGEVSSHVTKKKNHRKCPNDELWMNTDYEGNDSGIF